MEWWHFHPLGRAALEAQVGVPSESRGRRNLNLEFRIEDKPEDVEVISTQTRSKVTRLTVLLLGLA